MWIVFGLIILTVVVVGCSDIGPLKGKVDFWTDDPLIYEATVSAIDVWANVGVAKAATVTVELIDPRQNEEWKKKGRLPITRMPRDQLHKPCVLDPGYRGDGCGSIDGNNEYTGIHIPEDLNDLERLKVVMIHELGHIIAESREHAPVDSIAIMHPDGTSQTPTDADIEYMRTKTLVLDPEDVR